MLKQTAVLTRQINEEIRSILVIGGRSTGAGKILKEHYNSEVSIIVDDEDSLLSDRLGIKGEKNISVRLMDYSNTDFNDSAFDMVYAQASVSGKGRNKIVKEIRRVLKKEGILCSGEITRTGENIPPYISGIWESSGIAPLDTNALVAYYTERKFKLLLREDLKSTLTEYYSLQSELLTKEKEGLTENEKSYYKKLLSRISHESGVYLKMGGDKYMGYEMLILRKTE